MLHELILKAQRADKESMQEIVNYIATSIKNYYVYSISQKNTSITLVHMSDLSENQRYFLEAKSATSDRYDSLLLDILKQCLTRNEFEIIYLHYFKEHSLSDIAEAKNRSRQAVSQMNLRSLKKLSDFLS